MTGLVPAIAGARIATNPMNTTKLSAAIASFRRRKRNQASPQNPREGAGGAIEIVDLRTLMPFDQDAITAAVKEANRVLIATEETDHTSFGRHIHSWTVEHCFYDLDCTPAFISAIAAPAAPYHAVEETAFFPTALTIEEKIDVLLAE